LISGASEELRTDALVRVHLAPPDKGLPTCGITSRNFSCNPLRRIHYRPTKNSSRIVK